MSFDTSLFKKLSFDISYKVGCAVDAMYSTSPRPVWYETLNGWVTWLGKQEFIDYIDAHEGEFCRALKALSADRPDILELRYPQIIEYIEAGLDNPQREVIIKHKVAHIRKVPTAAFLAKNIKKKDRKKKL